MRPPPRRAPESEPEATGDPDERPCLWRWLGIASVIALVLFFLLAGGLLAARWYVLRDIPPSELARMRQFMSEPFHFPREWEQVEGFPSEVLAGQEALNTAWGSHAPLLGGELSFRGAGTAALQELRERRTTSAENWTSFTSLVSSGMPLLEETSRVVALAGYDMDATLVGLWPDLNSEHGTARLACIAGHLRAQDGKWEEAFQFVLLPLQRSRRNSLADETVQYGAHGIQQQALESLVVLVEACPEADALRNVLATLNGLRKELHPALSRQGSYSIGVVGLRHLKRYGYPVDLKPGKSQAFYWEQAVEGELAFPRWMLARLPAGDPNRSRFEDMARNMGSVAIRHRLKRRLMRAILPEMLYKDFQPGDSQIETGEKVALAGYDLTRLAVARRLRELEGQDLPTSASAYVGDSLPEVPLDPFTGTSFLWSERSRCFYSVGPDGTDDRLTIIYDSRGVPARNGDTPTPAHK